VSAAAFEAPPHGRDADDRIQPLPLAGKRSGSQMEPVLETSASSP